MRFCRGNIDTLILINPVLHEKTRLTDGVYIPSGVFFFCRCFTANDRRIGCFREGKYMGLAELFILAVALSMDAFAVAMCKGLAMQKISIKNAGIVGLWFGGFQALMPLIGYFLGVQFEEYITAVDHWIAFILLALIGAQMIKESFSKKEEPADASLVPKKMLVLALATSIDALAAGVSLACTPNTNIWFAILFIGVMTFLLSSIGVKLGNVFGTKYKSKAEFCGGLILILLGLKILLEDLGVLTLPI